MSNPLHQQLADYRKYLNISHTFLHLKIRGGSFLITQRFFALYQYKTVLHVGGNFLFHICRSLAFDMCCDLDFWVQGQAVIAFFIRICFFNIFKLLKRYIPIFA